MTEISTAESNGDAVRTDALRWDGAALVVLGSLCLLASVLFDSGRSLPFGVLLLAGSFVVLRNDFLAFGSVGLGLLYAFVGVVLLAVPGPSNRAQLLVFFFLLSAYIEVDGWDAVRRLNASGWLLLAGVWSLVSALFSSALLLYVLDPVATAVGTGLLLGSNLLATGFAMFSIGTHNGEDRPPTADVGRLRARFRRYVFGATVLFGSSGVFLGGVAAARSLDSLVYESLSRLADWQQMVVVAGAFFVCFLVGALLGRRFRSAGSLRTRIFSPDRPMEVGVGVPVGAFVVTASASWLVAAAFGGWPAMEAVPTWTRLVALATAIVAVGWAGARVWDGVDAAADSLYPSGDSDGGADDDVTRQRRGIGGYLQTAISTLRADLRQYDRELASYRSEDPNRSSDAAAVSEARREIAAAEELLTQAEARLENGDLLFCLQYYYDARVKLPYAFHGLDEIRGTPTTGRLREEAVETVEVGRTYLGSAWADRTRADLLTKRGELRRSVGPETVQNRRSAVASEVIGELESVLVFRRLLTFSASVIAVGLLAFGAALWSGVELFAGLDESYGPVFRQNAFVVLVFLLGAVGSALNTVRTWSDQVMVLRQIQTAAQLSISTRVTAVRALVGGTAAVFVYFFLLSGIVAPQFVTPGLALAAAVAAGFSDQLFLTAVEKITSVVAGPNADGDAKVEDDDEDASDR